MAVSLPHSLAVTSGKGGVGKSCVALNLAVAFARQGDRVLLIDADWGLGNLALLLGQAPSHSLEEVLTGACEIDAALLEGPDGVVLLPAASEWHGPSWEQVWCSEEVAVALGAFEMDFDRIVVDTGAGVGANVVDAAVAASGALLVTTPEATAIADTYALLKILRRNAGGEAALLVNMAEDEGEAEELQERFAELTQRFLGAEIDNAGYIPLDRFVRQAVKRQLSFMDLAPPCPAALAVEELARRCRDFGTAELGGQGFFERLLGRRLALS